MNRRVRFAVVVCGLLLAAGASRGEVRVVSERNAGSAATMAFKFKAVSAPSRTDAGGGAKIEIVDGRADVNGAGLRAVQDGRLPDGQDEPGANFFFAAGSEGGRLLVDLGAPVEVRQVNTYSWHATTRGPQVYRLYAADGTAKGFRAKPAAGTDPAEAGWKLLASVDTRPKSGPPGGQYGVSIRDSGGAALGTFRYLLLSVRRTEGDDPFGNTFFSEIDVDDGKRHEPPPPPPGVETVTVADRYEIVYDYSEMPELKPWIDARLKPACAKWYPAIVAMLPSDGYEAPRRATVTFRKGMSGVAGTSGTHVQCAGRWFAGNLEGEAVGAVIHELVHVVQQYRGVRGGRRNPGWLVEGLADYIRWFLFEPPSKRPRPDPARAKYTDSYRTTGAFLNYVVQTHDKEIVPKLNTAMRRGRYDPELWKQHTGKTIDELWADYVKTLQAP